MRIVACIALLLGSCYAADLAPLARDIRAGVKPDEAMEYVRRVWSTDRYFTFPKFQETAEYLKQTMTVIGLSNVEIVAAPADGTSQFGYWTMPLAWDVKQATLEIVEPESHVLADYQKTPCSLCMWSGPTPHGGITAEVVEYKKDADLRGKLVLTSQNPANIKWELVKAGALGAINAFTENRDLKDGRQWVNAWGDYGWAFTKASTPLVCFSLSPREAERLGGLMKKGRVRVRAKVASRYYAGTYPYVTGVLPGSGSDEEVLTLGHTSEQGAQDNATGVAAMLESLATLNRLIASGKLVRPQRSIRILALGELYGSMHYIAKNPERIRRTVAAMCVDTPAALYNLAGTEYTFYQNPHSGHSFVDSFILRVAEAALSPRFFHWKPYMTGTDNYLGEPSVGIPTAWPYSGSGVHTHHNSEDTPESVDPRSLRDLAAVDATFLYYLASAGEPEAKRLAEVALTRALEQLARSVMPALDRRAAAPDAARWLYDSQERVRYWAERETQAIFSVVRLVPPERREQTVPFLMPLVEQLQRFGVEQSQRLQRAAGPVKPAPPPPDPVASQIVVKRKRFGTLPLDDLAPDQREGYPSGAWAGVPVAALYWCDGKRNLAEVIRLTKLEMGPTDFDFAGYFRFLAKRGYVELVSPP